MPETYTPQDHEKDRTVYEIGRGVSWIAAILFMLALWLPPLCEHLQKAATRKWSETPAGQLFSWKPGGDVSIVQHLHGIENKLDRSLYSTSIRQTVQGWLTGMMGEGNAKVLVGGNGWLFYQPDVKALTGYGPLKPEPFSVMKDPELAKLPETRDVIAGFVSQLKERGISLLLVPLPLKPMIYSEYITGVQERAWVTHPDAPAFYNLLRSQGVDVLDLTEEIAKMRSQRKYVFRRVPAKHDREVEAEEDERLKKTLDAFLMQDTHWTPEAMRRAAELVAKHVKEHYPTALRPSFHDIRAVDGWTRHSMGDLVKLLDVKNPEEIFEPEAAFLKQIGEGTESKDSPIVVLGDSFVNIYNDPTLGFGDPAVPEKEQRMIHAGFAQHLSLLLNQPLDLISITGKGSTGVRQELGKRYDDQVRAKKLVIWVIASRDLLLSKTAAHAADITWAPVVFNPHRSPDAIESPIPAAGTQVVVEAKLVEKSKNQSLDSPYRDALHTALYDVEKVVSGKYEGKQVLGVQWTFKDKQMAPPSGFGVGQHYRLTLKPWDQAPELHQLNLEDDTSTFEAERWYVEKAEALP